MTAQENPYTPPTMDGVGGEPWTRPPTSAPTGGGSLAMTAFAAIAAFAFISFTILLLRSTPVDRQAGAMFLLNAPIFAGMALSAVRSRQLAGYFAMAATLMQIAITIAFLVLPIGDPPTVIIINFLTILPCLLMLFWAWCTKDRTLCDQGK